MDASRIIASIPIALESMQLLFELYSQLGEKRIKVIRHRLRVLRTFLLCSTYFRNDDDRVEASQLGSLLVRAEDVVRGILDDHIQERYEFYKNLETWSPIHYFQGKVASVLVDLESLEEDIDKWYISALPDYNSQVQANQVMDIADSVVENLDDFLSFHRVYVGVLVEPVEALKESIKILRNVICFATLLCGENQEFQCLLTHIEPLAISAAHVTLHLFSASHYNPEVFSLHARNATTNPPYDDMEAMISALLLRIKLVDSPLLHVTYTRALESLKHSRELYIRNLQTSDGDPLILVKDFIVFLLYTAWEMLQLDTSPVVFLRDELQALYEGLRSLRTMLHKHSSKFDDNIRKITGAAICDAGFLIFSLYEKDSVIDLGVREFQEKIKVIQAELLEEQTSRFNSPKINVLGLLDSLLDYLMEVKSSEVDSDVRSCVPEIREDVVFLRSFLGKLAELRNQQEDLHLALWNHSVEVAYRLEFLIDQLVLGKMLYSFPSSFQSVADDIKTIKTDSMNIFDEIKVERVNLVSTYVVPSQSPLADEVVGFVAERASVLDRLTRGLKKLQIVAIVGMPGLGKTTLASRVYNDPCVTYRFHVRARCSISQVLNKRQVLLDLLNQISSGASNSSMNEYDLAQELRRSLKRRRYLIFLDDIWDIEAFHSLKESFPDDSTESRILVTSRISDVGILDEEPLFLRQITIDESLELLQRKLFPGKDWPSSVYEVGVQIAEICKGLPLTVVIVSGLLTTTEEQVWKKVLESLRSGEISSIDQCMNTIDLSYKHLPDHLQACLVSIGKFPEDEEVPVKRLIWLWTAEGFIPKSKLKSSEEVAAECVRILIRRSLLINAKDTSRGGTKACRIHDLLRDFCLRKANEENHFHLLKRHNDLSLPDEFEDPCYDELGGNMRRLCIHSRPEHFQKWKLFCPSLRSLSLFHPVWAEKLDVSFICRIYQLLRVLDLEQVYLNTKFPSDIGLLLQLRYLAIKGSGDISISIGNLSNLETLILYCPFEDFNLPYTFWNLQKLRRLYLNPDSGQYKFQLPVDNLEHGSRNMPELEVLSPLRSWHWDIMEKQLQKFPNIRRLKGILYSIRDESDDPVNSCKLMAFSFLSQLESLSLKISNGGANCEFIFPETLRKLSLEGCKLPWIRISSIAELPNLEVLKLLRESFIGDTWHVEEGEFPKLKFLKLGIWKIVNWTASDDQFSNLEKLVLEECYNLEVIPECLESVATLKMIEVTRCSECVTNSVRNVEDYQKEMGNSVLQVHIHS